MPAFTPLLAGLTFGAPAARLVGRGARMVPRGGWLLGDMMLDWISQLKGISREDAYMVASAAMDLVVTQNVDGTKGIHALMPKAIFTR